MLQGTTPKRLQASNLVIWSCTSSACASPVQIGPGMAARKNQQRAIHLVGQKASNPETLLREAMAENYKTGEIVPHSGIYQVTHAEHRLPHEVTLLRANSF